MAVCWVASVDFEEIDEADDAMFCVLVVFEGNAGRFEAVKLTTCVPSLTSRTCHPAPPEGFGCAKTTILVIPLASKSPTLS